MNRTDDDERRRIVLREERVRVGIARAVWRSDVPVVRETVTISRQTVSHGAAEEIAGDRTWVFPLSSERVIVKKRTVVEDELAIGLRSPSDGVRGTVRPAALRVAYDAAEEAP